MNKTQEQIVKIVTKLQKANVTKIVENLPDKKTRSWVSTQLNELARADALVRSKEGMSVYYAIPEKIGLLSKQIRKSYINKSLKEDIIYDEIKEKTPIFKGLNEDVESILNYAFTEMFNNAIEHSDSKKIEILFNEIDGRIAFEVRDYGIGVFKNIMQKKNLESELEAIQELSKGKTTTLPHSHSGEGIFFTSKIADLFILDSYEYRLRVDNIINDLFVEKISSLTGTCVRFEITRNSKKHISDIFREYEAEPGSHSFDKTKVHIKLFKAGTIYISRSQARRLMLNLEKFKLVILDFEGIETVGQAFADEVFRVFISKHPNIEIKPINMKETVKFMIDRVESPAHVNWLIID